MPNANPVLGAGTIFEAELDAVGDPGTYSEIPELLSAPALGEEGSFVDVTPVSATTKKYVPGMKDTSDATFEFNDTTASADQKAFWVLADAGATLSCRMTYPNGRIGTVDFAFSGVKVLEPDSEGQVKVAVNGKQSGAVVWTGLD